MERTPESFKNIEFGYEGVAEFYDLFASNEDLPLYLEYAKKQGSPILDVAAGTGRVTLALAGAGFVVHALEKSPSMLNIFRRKTAESEAGKLVKIHQGDMTDFRLDTRYPMIIIPASFGHALTEERQISTLRTIKNHLGDDGVFILDLYMGEHIDEYSTFQDGPTSMPDGRVVKRYGEMTINREKQMLNLTLRFEVRDADGRVSEERVVQSGTAVINREKADSLIQNIGFEIVEEFGDFQMSPYTTESSRRILILTH